MQEIGILIYVCSFILSAVGSNRICSVCYHMEFSSKDSNAKLPDDVVNKACLNHGDSFKHHETVLCEKGVTLCKKVEGKAQLNYKGMTMQANIFVRECGPEIQEAPEECVDDTEYLPNMLKQKGATDITLKAKACYCDSNHCNTATTTAVQSILLPFLSLAAALIL